MDVVAPSYSCIEELMGEMELSLGVIRGVEHGSLEALQLENTILRAWIALHLKSGEMVDVDEWVKDYCHNIHEELS
ncbi:MAG: hypothetical protein LUE13_02455 [Akkermansiaceae bacterium]|nr:hypothetical protein [Akkermansiaceae bacterium]